MSFMFGGNFVRRSGDTMVGNLDLGLNKLYFGNSTDGDSILAKAGQGQKLFVRDYDDTKDAIINAAGAIFSDNNDEGVLVDHTGVTGWTNLKKFTIPANTLGINGSLMILVFCHSSGVNNTKFCRIRFGGVTLATVSYAAGGVGTGWLWGIVHNQGVANHQHWTSFAVEETAIEDTNEDTACNVDTAAAVDIDVDGSLTNAADHIQIRNFKVIVKRS